MVEDIEYEEELEEVEEPKLLHTKKNKQLKLFD